VISRFGTRRVDVHTKRTLRQELRSWKPCQSRVDAFLEAR
jgi:hypothetical protein